MDELDRSVPAERTDKQYDSVKSLMEGEGVSKEVQDMVETPRTKREIFYTDDVDGL